MKSIPFILLFSLPSLTYGQFEISGVVLDSIGPIPYANVTLKNQDEKIVTGVITTDDGNFTIQAEKGTYSLNIAYVGYATLIIDLSVDTDKALGSIFMYAEVEQLEEVVLFNPRKIIERKIDRLVFNVENNVTTIGGTSLDALKISPGVSTTEDGIQMIGKSAMRLMVDGKIIPLEGDALIVFLNTIPSDDIKEIEIITNPPAKYDAEGNSGLINLIYKKGRKNSWNNTSTVSLTQARLSQYSFRNNFNYRKNDLSLLLSLDVRTGNTHVERFSDIFYPNQKWSIERVEKWGNDQFSGRIMIDYDLGEKSKIGIQYLGSLSNQNPSQVTRANTEIFNNNQGIDSLLVDNARSVQNNNNHSLNTYYEVKLDTIGRTLVLNLDYFNYNSAFDRTIQTESFTPENEYLNSIFSNLNVSDQNLSNWSGRIDFEYPLKKINLSFGAKLSFTETNYKTNNFNLEEDSPDLNPSFSDDFDYNEDIQAIYGSASTNLGEQIEIKVGMRLENTLTLGTSNILNETTEINYLRAFPTLYISYSDDNSKNSLTGSYGRRIRRPLFYQLNPARIYISNNNFMEGNPILQPSFIDNFEISYTYNNKLTTTAFLSKESEGFDEISDINEATNEQFFTYQNFYTQFSYGLSQFYSFTPLTWWESRNSMYLTYNHSNIDAVGIDIERQNGMRFYTSTNNTFSLNSSKTFRGQINFWYSSPFKSNLYDFSESFSLDIATSLSLFNKKMNLSMGVYDIFNSSPRKSTFITNGIEQTQQNFWSNRNFRISLVYNTGNRKIKVNQREFGNEDEKRRVY